MVSGVDLSSLTIRYFTPIDLILRALTKRKVVQKVILRDGYVYNVDNDNCFMDI